YPHPTRPPPDPPSFPTRRSSDLGSRASNGVILITTKRNAGGKATIRYESYASQQTLFRSPDFLTAADYRRLIPQGYGFQDLGYRSEEHTSELQSRSDLVCRLLLE